MAQLASSISNFLQLLTTISLPLVNAKQGIGMLGIRGKDDPTIDDNAQNDFVKQFVVVVIHNEDIVASADRTCKIFFCKLPAFLLDRNRQIRILMA